jgi:hypothetical protein
MLSNYLLAVVMCAACIVPALSHGTFFVAFIRADLLAVAIDSREVVVDSVTHQERINDRDCKIAVLDQKTVFFSAGATAARHPGGAIDFSSDEIAQAIFREEGSKEPKDLAERWAQTIRKRAEQHIERYRVQFPNGWFGAGHFGGFEGEGEVVLYTATLTYDAGRLSHDIKKWASPNDVVHTGAFPDIIEDIFGVAPKPAMRPRFNAEVPKQPAQLSQPSDRVALMAITAVQAAIDRNSDSGIGGSIASIILERGKTLRWFRRPDFCPEN